MADVISRLLSEDPHQIKDALEYVAWTQNRDVWRAVLEAASQPESLDADPPAVLTAASLIQRPDAAQSILRAVDAHPSITVEKMNRAIAALVSIGPEAIPVLVEVLRSTPGINHPPALISAMALSRLGTVSVQRLVAILRGYQKATHDGRLLAAQSLSGIASDRAAESLADALQITDNDNLRAGIARAMGWQTACIPALTRLAVSDPSPVTRQAAIEALGDNGTPAALRALFRLANRPALDDAGRMLAVNTLAAAGGQDAVALLTDLLHDTELPVRVRQQAAIGLGYYQDDAVINALMEALRAENPSSPIYNSILRSLQYIGKETAKHVLLEYLDEARVRAPGAAFEIENVLASWDEPTDFPDLARRLRDVRSVFQQPDMRDRSMSNLADKYGAEIVPYLRRMIGAGEDSLLALDALGRTRSLSALRPLFNAAVGGTEQERVAAGRAFACIGPEAVHHLAHAIQLTDPGSVGVMADSLSGVGMQGQAMLRGVLEGSNLETQHALLRWMAERKADIPGLAQSAYRLAADLSQTTETRLLAWDALAASSSQQVKDTLDSAMRGQSDLNFLGASLAYGRRGGEGLSELIAYLKTDSPGGERRRVAVSILACSGSPIAWPTVCAEMDETKSAAAARAAVELAWHFGDLAVDELERRAVEQPVLASEAVESLARIQTERAAQALSRLENADRLDPIVRGLARRAYGRLYRSFVPAPAGLPAPIIDFNAHPIGDIDLAEVQF